MSKNSQQSQQINQMKKTERELRARRLDEFCESLGSADVKLSQHWFDKMEKTEKEILELQSELGKFIEISPLVTYKQQRENTFGHI
jgi:hypothetical protein